MHVHAYITITKLQYMEITVIFLFYKDCYNRVPILKDHKVSLQVLKVSLRSPSSWYTDVEHA